MHKSARLVLSDTEVKELKDSLRVKFLWALSGIEAKGLTLEEFILYIGIAESKILLSQKAFDTNNS